MSRTEVMFFFDTEDFVAEKSSDAAKKLAEICTEEGVVGHFAVVGLLAKRLMKDGRTDVIEALNQNEVGTHTYGHTLHPNICEMADVEDYKEAYRRISEVEGEGIELVQKAFGREKLLFAVPPGNSKSYAAMYYFADAGIPFFCDTVVTDARNSDVHCANAMHIAYADSVESFAFGGLDLKNQLERYAQMQRVIIYTHPNKAYFEAFWDTLNFKGENLHGEGDYIIPPIREIAETEHYFNTFRDIIRTIKADDRFRITSLREILSAQPAREAVMREQIPEISSYLNKDYAPISGMKLCLYDVFMAATAFLRGGVSYQPGKAYGLLKQSEEIDHPIRLTVEGVMEAAKAIPQNDFLPSEFAVDGQKVGTGDMLYAMLQALKQSAGEFVLEPHPKMTFLDCYPQLRDMSLRGTWMHSTSFEDKYISDRMRLQAYTIW